jgi:hypothetical protein
MPLCLCTKRIIIHNIWKAMKYMAAIQAIREIQKAAQILDVAKPPNI